jgi:hypothetical protein
MEPMSPHSSSLIVSTGIFRRRPFCPFRAANFFCSFPPHGWNQDSSCRICEMAQATGQELFS